jgi:hypothetical protein
MHLNTGTLGLTVNNVAPSVSAVDTLVTVNEAVTAFNSGSFFDPGADTVTITTSVGTVTQGAGTWSWSFDSTDGPDQSQTVTITATDSDGAFTSVTFDLTVNNVAPSVAVDDTSVTVNEAVTAYNNGTFFDPGADSVTVTTSVGTVTQGTGTWNWSFGSTDGPDQSQPVTITATDSDGAFTSVTFDLTVVNVAPTIALSGASTVDEGSTYTLTLGAITDPGADVVSQYIVDWNDGTSDTYLAGGNVIHTYADGPAAPTITVDLVDEDGTHLNTGSLGLTITNVAPDLGAITAPLDPVLINTQIDVS